MHEDVQNASSTDNIHRSKYETLEDQHGASA